MNPSYFLGGDSMMKHGDNGKSLVRQQGMNTNRGNTKSRQMMQGNKIYQL